MKNSFVHLRNVSAALDKLYHYGADYENITLLSDFNVEVKEK